jgi:guanylate kinase
MSEQAKKRPRIVIVSGPSGVGKTTICKRLLERMDNLYLSTSTTTRPKSDAEVDGDDYWFLSDDEFEQRARKGMFLEHAEVFGSRYGTPRDKVEQALEQGKTVILEIDVQGAKQVKAQYPDAVMIFILPPTQGELAERINDRGREDSEASELRLDGASFEIAAGWQYYKHMVINDEVEQAVKEVMQIIEGAEGQ